MEELKEIETLLFIVPGAPAPIVLSNEHKLNVLYYYQREIADINVDIPKQRNTSKDEGIANVAFENYLIYKFGYPNAEILQSHPYYKLGLRWYKLYEITGSTWIKDIEQMNQKHPLHNPTRYKIFKHFIITFEDSTFECIAKGVEISFSQKVTMKNAIEDTILQLGLQ
jgi:hypothetical protein